MVNTVTGINTDQHLIKANSWSLGVDGTFWLGLYRISRKTMHHADEFPVLKLLKNIRFHELCLQPSCTMGALSMSSNQPPNLHTHAGVG